MSCTCVVGLQWGDEAKGKVVDLLAEDHHFVVRYNGGNNAGHTVVWGDRTFKLSLLPTGTLKPNVTSVIGNGVVVYPPQFIKEIDQLAAGGIAVETATEQGEGSTIGTTGRGIGPCYQDKVGRSGGIRVGELLHPDHLRQR